MAKPYFLTRQTANLMEDFSRELPEGSALFLLHGDSGVGKTRLLRELCRIRLADKRVHWIDLGQGISSEDSLQDSSETIETIFDAAVSGDIIIADHFEMALQKNRHQLFVSWSTDSVDKQLNLIVASSTESFDELRQLSQQYQVEVKSSRLEQLDNDEVDAFINFFLFPDSTPGRLSMPAVLRRQLTDAQGTVGEIIALLRLHGKQIKSSPVGDSGSKGKIGRVPALGFMLLLAIAGVGWYYLNNPSASFEAAPERVVIEPAAQTTDLTATKREPEIEVTAESSGPVENPLNPEIESASHLETENSDQSQSIVGTQSESEIQTTLATESTSEAENSPATELEEQDRSADETGISVARKTESEVPQQAPGQNTTMPVEVADSNDQTTEEAKFPGTERFQRDLENSYSWVNNKADSVGTLQIMLLSYKTFNEAVFYEYVESLAKKQVDITQLKVFKTYTGGKEFYGVFYGEYASPQLANKARGDLPEVIRDIPPVARSVGSILKEIRRLEGES